ncbi:hypothetical protein OAS86_02575 [Gammaproteobacteria bacterium]|nr:hypothetical protein [Gammaproteobacteria bacterium]
MTIRSLVLIAATALVSGCATVDDMVGGDCKSMSSLASDVLGSMTELVSGSISNCDEMIDKAKRSRDISDDRGLIIHRVTRAPGNVRRGRKLTLSICYEVYGFDKSINVTERRDIVDGCDDTPIDSVEQVYRRSNGAYESKFSFQVPRSWDSGSYYVTQQIDSPDAEATPVKRLPLSVR